MIGRFRISNGVLMIAMIVGAIVTYDMKYRAELAATGIERLQSDIGAEKDRIRTLNAEWSALTQPSRLRALVTEHGDYFGLKPFAPDQIATVADIPMKAGAATDPAHPASGDGAVRATLARIATGGALRGR